MNINKYLLDFLKDNVNIDDTRLLTAKSNIAGVTSVIENSELFWPILVGKPSAQWSIRHKTIIKPINTEDTFDTDLLIEINKPASWSYSDCLTNLWCIFLSHWVYKNKVDLSKTRCITLNYAWQNSIDIVPTFKVDWDYYIVNGSNNQKELSDGEWFSKWFDQQDGLTNNNLKKIIRLVKYIRNYHNLFDIRSIHLNVLFGNAVKSKGDFTNFQTSLVSIISSLNGYLKNKNHIEELNLINPANKKENLGKWNRNLKDSELFKLKKFVSNLDILFSSGFDDENIIIWLREYFWDSFWESFYEDKCVSIQSYQWRDIFKELQLTWKDIRIPIFITNPTYEKKEQYFTNTTELHSGELIDKWVTLIFQCNVNSNEDNCNIYWQVLNTWNEARDKWQLRWDFSKWKSKQGKENFNSMKNIETTLFSGIHWVKCYVVKDELLIGESNKFFVNVK